MLLEKSTTDFQCGSLDFENSFQNAVAYKLAQKSAGVSTFNEQTRILNETIPYTNKIIYDLFYSKDIDRERLDRSELVLCIKKELSAIKILEREFKAEFPCRKQILNHAIDTLRLNL